MKLIFRILLITAFLGSLFWIYKDRGNIGAYIAALTTVATFIGSFISLIKKDKTEPIINVELITVGHNSHRLVFSNTSSEDAYDINLPIKANPNHPVLKDVYERTFPIKTIYAKSDKEFIATVKLEANEFDLTWHWKNKKGKSFSRSNIVSVKS
ncbi:MAG: hypothetical protein ACUZ77_11680 [Candidatus Brocadiales bacterium]